MEMGRTCRKVSSHRMGAGYSYVGFLLWQEKQKQAKHQMGRLFQQTSGPTLVQSGARQKWVESVGKPVKKNQQTMIYDKFRKQLIIHAD